MIFLKWEHFGGIITMYYDQGQIAMKLLSFDGGVMVQGGLLIPVTTPAHGMAFDITGKNLAGVTSVQNAFDVAAIMAERRIRKENGFVVEEAAMPVKNGVGVGVKTARVEVPSCC
jgi:4-hydroxythreonine-4-phosphate dehydrogenase